MPYIDSDRRQAFAQMTNVIPTINNGGELNYLVSTLVGRFLGQQPLTYARIAEALAAVEGAKMELYRLTAAPYEDTKRRVNGEVYPERIIL
jgi:hypothetical protein